MTREPVFAARRRTPSFALFSGGHDSLTSTYVAMTQGIADAVVHVNTGIGIDETRQFVRETCRAYDWPLYELHPPTSYDEICISRGWTRANDGTGDRLYGMPGPGMHPVAYRMLKERALAAFARQMKTRRGADALVYVTGVRREESKVRMGRVERWRVDKKKGWSWLALNFDWTKSDCNDLISREGIPRNPVVDTLHMSGECLCGTFASPGERSEIRLWFPAADARIAGLEARVGEAGHLACRWGKRPPNVHRYQLAFEIEDEQMLCQSCPTRAAA